MFFVWTMKGIAGLLQLQYVLITDQTEHFQFI